MVSGSIRWLPRTRIERIVRSTGAGVAAGVGWAGVAAAGAAGAVRGAAGAGWGAAAPCASSGAAEPPNIVPTRSRAPARRLKVFDLEITRPRLVCNWCERRASPQSPCFCPAPTLLANQALKPVPQAQRAQIVDGREENQCEDDRKAAPERPFQ